MHFVNRRWFEYSIARRRGQVRIDFFKPNAQFARGGRVVGDAIYEKQRQHFQALFCGQTCDSQFFLEVFLDGFFDLDAHDVIGVAALRLPNLQCHAIGERNRTHTGVDARYDIAAV